MVRQLWNIDPMKLVLRLLHYTGALHLGNAGSLIYKCYTCFVGTWFTIHVACQVAAIWPSDDEDTGSMDQMTLVTCVTLSTGTALFKFILISARAETLRTMAREIEALPPTPLDAECQRRSIVLIISLFVAGYSSVISWLLEPIIVGRRHMPAAVKLPFDIVQSDGRYAVAVLMQATLLLIMVSLHFGIDALCCITIITVCTQLRDVGSEIENSVIYRPPLSIFIPTKGGREHLKQHSDILGEIPFSYEHYVGKIKQCVKRHQDLVRIAGLLESSMNVIIFSQSIACLFVSCFLSYQMSTHLENVGALVKMTIYLVAVVIQLFVYSWFGSELMSESANIGFSAYNSAWNDIPSPSNELRHILIMTIMRSQRPLAVTCGKFLPMSRTLFLKVLYNSYSCFTLLRIIGRDR